MLLLCLPSKVVSLLKTQLCSVYSLETSSSVLHAMISRCCTVKLYLKVDKMTALVRKNMEIYCLAPLPQFEGEQFIKSEMPLNFNDFNLTISFNATNKNGENI